MEQSITDILQTIDDAINSFQDKIPGIQKLMFDELQPLLKELKLQNGKLLNNVDNLKLLGSIKNKLQKILINPEYKDAVKKFIDSYDILSALNMTYFAQFNQKFTPSATLPFIKQLAIESTITDLVGQGMSETIVGAVKDILNTNITTGGSYASLQDQLRDHLLNTETGDGSLVKYTKQITETSISQYNAQYNAAIAQDLNFNWYRYVGSLLTTSRELCIWLTEKDYIHKREIPEIVKGHIDGHKCKLSKITGLPLGMIEGTDADNFKMLRGGWECKHQLLPVPDSAVPDDVKKKFESKTNNPISTDVAEASAKSLVENDGKFEVRKDSLKNAGALGKYGLEDYEAVSILGYTGKEYSKMNKVLRGQIGGDNITKAYIEATKTGLSKLPDYKGIVYRGTSLSESQFKLYQEALKNNTTVKHDYFTSTTRSSGKQFHGNTKFIIQSQTGKDVTFLSRHGDEEDEVLFNSGTEFNVDKITTIGETAFIYLVEN